MPETDAHVWSVDGHCPRCGAVRSIANQYSTCPATSYFMGVLPRTEFTPTTKQLRAAYLLTQPADVNGERAAIFDRWYAKERARAQLEVLQWLDEHGVSAEQLDMALEKFVEPYGLTHAWKGHPHVGD